MSDSPNERCRGDTQLSRRDKCDSLTSSSCGLPDRRVEEKLHVLFAGVLNSKGSFAVSRTCNLPYRTLALDTRSLKLAPSAAGELSRSAVISILLASRESFPCSRPLQRDRAEDRDWFVALLAREGCVSVCATSTSLSKRRCCSIAAKNAPETCLSTSSNVENRCAVRTKWVGFPEILAPAYHI